MVRDATVRIHGRSAQGATDASGLWGSGFFIAPGKVLTCAHIFCQRVAGRHVWRGDGELGISFRLRAGEMVTVPGRLVHCLPGPDEVPESKRALWPTPDLAVIELDEPVAEHPCVWLSDRSAPPVGLNDNLLYLGFTRDEYGDLSPWDGSCRVAGSHGDHVLRLDGGGGEIKAGLSGGPVVDPGRGAVVGMIKSRRNNQDGGNGVRITALRELSSTDPPGEDPYQELILAHDQWHWRVQREGGRETHTWASVQSDLPTPGRGWLPLDRVHALGLLAELPQAPDVGTIERLVDDACPKQRITGIAVPRSWRDGAGLLYDAYPGGEEKAILSYLIRVARRERTRALDQSTALREWALGRARTLREDDRNELARLARQPEPVELSARRPGWEAVPRSEPRLVPEADDVVQAPGRAVRPQPPLDGADVRALDTVPVRPVAPVDPFGPRSPRATLPRDAPCAPPAVPESDSAPHGTEDHGPDLERVRGDDLATVLLEFRAEWWMEHHYSWTVRLVRPAGDVELMAVGTPLHIRQLGGPPEKLLDALRQAALRADAGAYVAPLEVLLPQELFDIPVDDWRVSRSSRQETARLGCVRAVTIVDQRSFDRASSGGERTTWRSRRLPEGRPVATAPLLAPGHRDTAAGAVDTVLFHSGPVGGGKPGEALRRVLDAGPAAVVWRREDALPGMAERFTSEVGRLVRGICGVAELPHAVAALRASLDLDDPDSEWARGLAVLHDPERRPAVTTDLLDTP
ncbi:trypsin-like peptidase domain-containing protein [Streptomyces massasporeus]